MEEVKRVVWTLRKIESLTDISSKQIVLVANEFFAKSKEEKAWLKERLLKIGHPVVTLSDSNYIRELNYKPEGLDEKVKRL